MYIRCYDAVMLNKVPRCEIDTADIRSLIRAALDDITFSCLYDQLNRLF